MTVAELRAATLHAVQSKSPVVIAIPTSDGVIEIPVAGFALERHSKRATNGFTLVRERLVLHVTSSGRGR
jgi:hypothetical protein